MTNLVLYGWLWLAAYIALIVCAFAVYATSATTRRVLRDLIDAMDLSEDLNNQQIVSSKRRAR